MKNKLLFMLAFSLNFYFVNAQTIDNSSILMYLDFEGDMVDNSPATNFTFARKTTGSASGAGGNVLTYSSTDGRFGQYAIFNNSVYESANSVYNTANSASIAVWVRLDAAENTAASQIATVFDMANGPDTGTTDDDGQPQIRFRKQPSGGSALGNQFASSVTATENFSNARAEKETWYHVAYVHNAVAKTQSIYINGVLDKVLNYTTTPRNAQQAIIFGANKVGNVGQAILGDMDDFLLTSEILSGEQIRTIVNLGVEASRSSSSTTSIWNGSVSTDWNTANNWTPSGVPNSAMTDVVIPSGTPRPTATSITVNNLLIQENASLDVSGAVTANSITLYQKGALKANSYSGDLIYNIVTTIDNALVPSLAGGVQNPAIWQLLSSPVVGQDYNNAWIDDNYIGTGTALNRAIALYDNDETVANQIWQYFQSSNANPGTGTFMSGQGFSTRKKTFNYQADEELYTFKGTFKSTDTPLSITQGAQSNWNLIGNPYPSYILVSDLMSTANVLNITDANETVYVWNGTTYTGLPTTDYIAPGQGFFVNADTNTANNFLIETSMQSIPTSSVTFYRNADPKVTLSISDGTNERSTILNYSDSETLDLDPGKDIGMFTGIGSAFSLFTQLVSNDQGIPFERQALPNSDFETTVVPVGVKANSGAVITFSAEVQNLPTGINTYLEDRVANTFTRLDDGSNQTVTLDGDINGIGRFYLHTRSSVLGVNEVLLSSVSIYKSNSNTLTIAGLDNVQASIKLFNVLGKQVLNTSFTAKGSKEISLPSLASGVYIVQLQTNTGKLNKKIILE